MNNHSFMLSKCMFKSVWNADNNFMFSPSSGLRPDSRLQLRLDDGQCLQMLSMRLRFFIIILFIIGEWSLTRALVGSFYNAIWWGAGAIFSPPSYLRNYWADLQNSSSSLIALDNSSSENKKCWPRGHRWRRLVRSTSENVWLFALDWDRRA